MLHRSIEARDFGSLTNAYVYLVEIDTNDAASNLQAAIVKSADMPEDVSCAAGHFEL